MNNIMAMSQINWHFDDYPFFKMCGEITTSPDIQTFGLNCRFCPGICLQLDEFMQHLKDHHVNDITNLYAVNVDQTEYEEQLQLLSAINKNNGNCLTMFDAEMPLAGEMKKYCDYSHKQSEQENENTMSMLMPTTTTAVMEETIAPLLDSNAINDNHLDLTMCLPTAAIEATATATTTIQPAIDLVYIMENALPSELLTNSHNTTTPLAAAQAMDSLDDPLALTAQPQTIDQCIAQATKLVPTAITKPSTAIDDIEKSSENSTPPDEEDSLPTSTTIAENKPHSPRSLDTSQMASLRQLEHNKEFIIYLLEAYKNIPKLWNPNHSEYKYNARRSTYNELCAQIEKDWQLQLSGNEIYTLIKTLRARFCRELAKPNQTATKRKKLWYFEKMLFLREIIDSKRAERELKCDDTASEKSLDSSNSSLDSNKPNPHHERLAAVLTCYELEPALWNPEHVAYGDYDKKPCYEQIAAKLTKDYSIKLSADDCMKEMQKLLTRYRKELRVLIQHKGLYLPKLWCFEQMEFLRPIYTEQILKRMDKKKGILECNRRSNFLKASPISLNSLDEQYQFIEIYRNYPALWDIDHPDFRSTSFREKAYTDMLDELNVTLNLEATLDELQRTLLDLRKEYSAEKLKKLSNSACSTTLQHRKLSEFLDDNIGPFRCNDCHELIKTADQFKIHKSTHDGIQPFICTLCGKGFQLPGNLTVHIRRHKHDFPFTCEQCHKSFATSSEVIVHMRTHTGERPYICDYCGKSFKTWSFFDIHRRIHLKQSTFHCPICDKGFYEKNRYTDHMNCHLNIRKHLCNVCGKSFTTYGNLKKHNELHLPIKKYKCKLCSKRFAQFASLRWHKLRQHFEVLCENEQ